MHAPRKTSSPPVIAELQGLYGTYAFPEKLLQQIWSRGDFDQGATVLADGRPVRVVFPGHWNRLGGPDFREARIAIAGEQPVTGDVELHLHAEDWHAHHHAADPAYGRVILHVVLFPPSSGYRTRGIGGQEIPVLPLLPALPHDLESYAADAAIEALSGRSSAEFEALARRPPAGLAAELSRLASERWGEKVRYAAARVGSLGAEAALHHAALEVLGYRFNRAPMLRIATRFPIERWRTDSLHLTDVLQSEAAAWSRQGYRPANRPIVRLGQYRGWMASRPHWTGLVTDTAGSLPLEPHSAAALRNRLCGDAVPRTRFATFVADALLPLLAALHPREASRFESAWRRFPAGEAPAWARATLCLLDLPPRQMGIQGLLRYAILRRSGQQGLTDSLPTF